MGCDSHFLKLSFKFQFDDKMNWENYESFWHVDQIKPCSLLNLTNDNDKRIMNHFSNLQPLEKYENL